MKKPDEAEAVSQGGSDGRSQDDVDQTGAEDTVGDDGDGQGNSFSKYASLGGANDDAPGFKWNFVTSKLAELKSKSTAKTNQPSDTGHTPETENEKRMESCLYLDWLLSQNEPD